MMTTECKSRGDFLEQLKVLRDAGKPISSVYLYWFETKGTRQLKVAAGPAAKMMWNALPIEAQTQVALSLQSQHASSPEILKLEREYSDCLRRDYDCEGGSYDVRGDLKDAVFVIEHE